MDPASDVDYVGPNRLVGFTCEPLNESTGGEKACLLTLQLEDRFGDNQWMKDNKIELELTSSTVDTLLDGLHKIQNQLTAYAAKHSASK